MQFRVSISKLRVSGKHFNPQPPNFAVRPHNSRLTDPEFHRHRSVSYRGGIPVVRVRVFRGTLGMDYCTRMILYPQSIPKQESGAAAMAKVFALRGA